MPFLKKISRKLLLEVKSLYAFKKIRYYLVNKKLK